MIFYDNKTGVIGFFNGRVCPNISGQKPTHTEIKIGDYIEIRILNVPDGFVKGRVKKINDAVFWVENIFLNLTAGLVIVKIIYEEDSSNDEPSESENFISEENYILIRDCESLRNSLRCLGNVDLDSEKIKEIKYELNQLLNFYDHKIITLLGVKK